MKPITIRPELYNFMIAVEKKLRAYPKLVNAKNQTDKELFRDLLEQKEWLSDEIYEEIPEGVKNEAVIMAALLLHLYTNNGDLQGNHQTDN